MRFSWTLAAAGSLFGGLLGGLFVLPGHLIGPEHRVQVSLGAAQQSASGRTVQAAPPLALPQHAVPERTAKQHPKPVRHARPAVRPATSSNSLASVLVRTHPARPT